MGVSSPAVVKIYFRFYTHHVERDIRAQFDNMGIILLRKGEKDIVITLWIFILFRLPQNGFTRSELKRCKYILCTKLTYTIFFIISFFHFTISFFISVFIISSFFYFNYFISLPFLSCCISFFHFAFYYFIFIISSYSFHFIISFSFLLFLFSDCLVHLNSEFGENEDCL